MSSLLTPIQSTESLPPTKDLPKAKPQAWCMYFNTRHGCIKGDACTFLHVLTAGKQAKLNKQLQNKG